MLCILGKGFMPTISINEFIDRLKAMKKDGDITEDDLKTAEKDIQNLTDKYIAEIDNVVKAKENEVLEV